MSLIFPQEHRTLAWHLVIPAIHGALEKLRPNQRCVLADLAIFRNWNVNYDYLPMQNVIWRQVGDGSKELADFAAGQRIEHPGKIRVNRFSCFASQGGAFAHPIVGD